jgi:twitching motility protein PilT
MRHVSPIESLVAAVLKANGDGLVMHVGERPYVLAPNGSANLSERPLTVEAMKGVLGDLLSPDDQRMLSEVGAVEREMLPKDAPGDKFVLVAARGGDDIWIELRRQRGVIRVPQPVPAPAASPVEEVPPPGPAVQPETKPQAATQPQPPQAQAPAPAVQPADAIPAAAAAPPAVENPPAAEAPSPARTAPTHHMPVPETAPRPRMAPNHSAAQSQVQPPPATAPRATAPGPPPARADEPSAPPASVRRTGSVRESPSGVVLPLARSPIRPDTPRAGATPTPRYLGIGRLLRIASARGASSLFLTANARPSIRLDDEILPLETEPPLGKAEVEALILELAPGASREAFAGGTSAEWVYELQDVGRVRCVSFRDQRGPGAVFRLIPTRLISADQLGLSRDIQALCSEREGLVIVAGPRLSGKSTLISAFVDLINRSRSDYIISLETEIKFVHENRRAMVSQREARGEPDAMLTGARAALRENPDVLVIDDLKTPDLVAVALDAAESGHLVIGAVTAHTTSAAIGRLVETAPYDKQTQVALSLSEALRGAVAQVLLRKSGGGRVAARELLFNMPSVGALIAEGKIGQLPLAIDSGRKYGMVPMNDVLLAFVQSGAVDPREAYRKAYDRVAFLDLLKREGIDTSFVERLA